jgi:hypothetical protein
VAWPHKEGEGRWMTQNDNGTETIVDGPSEDTYRKEKL